MESSEFAAKYGPWALIAGASEGTGASFAHQLAEKGLNLVLVARREGPLALLAREIQARHAVECVTASVDLSADYAAERMTQLAGDREIGLLIFNAGADPNGSMFLDNDLANWDVLAMRNVMTVMRSCHAFGRPMRKRGHGGMIIVGSGACYGGLPGISAYGATKAFQLVLGEALWAELRPHGIDVLNLIMGKTDTPAFRELMEKLGGPFPDDCATSDEVAALGLERLPHGPVLNWGQADDEAGFLGTSAADRRRRIEVIGAMSAAYAKQTEEQSS